MTFATAMFVSAMWTPALLSAQARVPFVGCASDGQVGPLKPPSGTSVNISIPAQPAAHLAFYQAENGIGVLGPRGWFCFSTYGSNGSVLYISPRPLSSTEVLGGTWQGFAGPAIQLTTRVGDTSGRFDVARVVARLFPDRLGFTRAVIAEGLEPVSSFPTGPYPADKLIRRSRTLVEFETPPGTKGCGTDSRLRPGVLPIRGFAALVSETPDLIQLSLRLPPELEELVPTIIRQAEKDAFLPVP